MENSTHSLAHRYGCNFRILGLAQVVMSNGDLKPPFVDPISSSQWSTVCAGFWNAEVNKKDCITQVTLPENSIFQVGGCSSPNFPGLRRSPGVLIAYWAVILIGKGDYGGLFRPNSVI